MKFKKYLIESEEKNLIGVSIKNIELREEDIDKKWLGKFDCKKLGLTSLYGARKHITGNFNCTDNFNLKTLKYGPQVVKLGYTAQHCGLTSFEGCPVEVGMSANFGYNDITSLDGLLLSTKGTFGAYRNKITSLKDIHKKLLMAEVINVSSCPIESHVLGVLLIPGVRQILIGGLANVDVKVEKILNKYLGKGRAGLIDAQNELLDAGLEEYAQI